MSPESAHEGEGTNETRLWSLCWQAAVGRNFQTNRALTKLIRNRLIGAHQHSGRVLVDFLLLPGEIHAISQIHVDDSIESVARSFGNVISRWVRQSQPIRGPVLAGPYCALPIRSIEALQEEVRMLAWRPVVLKLCGSPAYHADGTLRIALGLTQPKGFSARPLLHLFGHTLQVSRAALRSCVARRPSDEEWRNWELIRGLELATGTVGPQPTLARALGSSAAALVAAGGSYWVDGALELLEVWVTAKISPSRPLDLRDSSDALAARGRALVACLAVNHRLCSAASVARHFRRAKATLCEQMTACRSRPMDRSILATPVWRILEDCALLKAESKARR